MCTELISISTPTHRSCTPFHIQSTLLVATASRWEVALSAMQTTLESKKIVRALAVLMGPAALDRAPSADHRLERILVAVEMDSHAEWLASPDADLLAGNTFKFARVTVAPGS